MSPTVQHHQGHGPGSAGHGQSTNDPQERQKCPLSVEQTLFGEELSTGQCVEEVPPHISMSMRVRGKVKNCTDQFDEENNPRS